MTSKARKLYLDTSILGYSLQKKDTKRRKEASDLLRNIRTEMVVGGYSYLTEREIRAAPRRLAQRLAAKIRWARLRRVRVRSRADAVILAQRYCDALVFPREFFEDALHVAIATYWRADAVVSYNFTHIVRLDTMAGVREINESSGLPTLFLCQPSEVIIA